jgi:hypothetical protein
MAEEGPALFTQDENTNEYVAYTPPEPKPFNETLDEELRDSEHLKGFQNANELAKSFAEMKSAQPVIPETADGYTFETQEGQELNAERMATWKTELHGLGLTQAQFEGIVNASLAEDAKAIQARDESYAESRKAAENALQTKWGDKYQENVEGAIKFRDSIMSHLPDEGKAFVAFLENTKFGDNPEVVEFFSHCASLISEDVINRGSPRASTTEVARTESGDPMLDPYKDMDHVS